MISNRTGKDPVFSRLSAHLDPWSDPAPAGSLPRRKPSPVTLSAGASAARSALPRRSNAVAWLRQTLRRPAAAVRALSRRRAVSTALLAGTVTAIAALSVTASHYTVPQEPLAAPAALSRVPTASQALATAIAPRRRHHFADAKYLQRLTAELSGIHPIRTIERFNPLRGIATWYGDVLQGHTTASGEIFDDTKMTAAHNKLPLGTVVRVTDLRSRRSVVVRINDRGILAPGRIIDLSSAAAAQLGILRAGVADVKLEILRRPGHGNTSSDQG